MRRYKKDERSSEWHHRNEDSSKDDWWSAVDIRTRGSVEGLVCQQSCCVVVRLMVDCFYVDVNSDEIIMDVTSES